MISKSTRPYLVRAVWEWCSDNGYTPYLVVQVDDSTRVPAEYVKNGEIVLNISADATHKLTLGNDVIQFAARFSGVSRECSVPMTAVRGIFARENGEGLFFHPQGEVRMTGPGAGDVQTKPEEPAGAAAPTEPHPPSPQAPAGGRKSHLQVIK